MSKRKAWGEVRRRRSERPASRAGYEKARLAYELGRQVRELREPHGLSQRQLAERMHTTQSVIARLEAGGSKPSISTLERVAKALGAMLQCGYSGWIVVTHAQNSAPMRLKAWSGWSLVLWWLGIAIVASIVLRLLIDVAYSRFVYYFILMPVGGVLLFPAAYAANRWLTPLIAARLRRTQACQALLLDRNVACRTG